MRAEFDVAIAGSGFAGSLLAMIARRLGRSVILLEKRSHPRFAIGESSTPLANLLLEELARRYDLPAVLPLCKWGAWQRSYPKIACGLKRGFTFYHHQLGKRWGPHPERANELLVAASPHDEIADTHWYRADFDQFLVEEAQRMGAEYRDHISLTAFRDGQVSGEGIDVRAKLVVDASGPRGFLNRVLNLGNEQFATMPATDALFAHFTNVARWKSYDAPPYPVEDAAVHHVFPGGWIWILHFNNGVTSAGVAATREVSLKYGFADGVKGWERLLRDLPSVRDLFDQARSTMDLQFVPNLAWRSQRAAGDGWALLPSAAGFVDPLLSTGFPLTLLGVQRLAKLLEEGADLNEYQEQTFSEVQLAATLVGRLYQRMGSFADFVKDSMLYFAAASFSESARRLNRRALAPGFLSVLQPLDLNADVCKTIEPFNVAGLFDPTARNWYPVRAEDLLANCWKLGVAKCDVEQMLRRTGFF
jgi:tetracycline 7-halogenase / FADH2 O2-dependent halogenase